jgi:hypothetical protein
MIKEATLCLFLCWACSLLVFIRCEEETQDSNKAVKLYRMWDHLIHLDEQMQGNCERKRLLVCCAHTVLWHLTQSLWYLTCHIYVHHQYCFVWWIVDYCRMHFEVQLFEELYISWCVWLYRDDHRCLL